MSCTIIAYGLKEHGRKDRKTIYDCLVKHGFSVALIEDDTLYIEDTEDFIIISGENLKEIYCQNLIYAPSINYPCIIPKLSEHNNLWVVLSDNGLPSSLNLPLTHSIITCGFGTRDTIAVASTEVDCFSISIQRPMLLVNGEIIPPKEVQIHTSRENVNSIIIGAVLIICGCDKLNF